MTEKMRKYPEIVTGRMNTKLGQELDQYKDLALLQTQTINAQNGILCNLEEQIGELRRMVLVRAGPGRSLGDLIMVEDDPVEDVVVMMEELLVVGPLAGPSRQVVTTLIKIED